MPRPGPEKTHFPTPAPASPSAVVLLPALRSTFNVDFHHERLGFRIVREERNPPGGQEGNNGFDAQGQSTAVSGDCDELARVTQVLSSLQSHQRQRTWSEDSSSTSKTRPLSSLNPEGVRIARRVKSGDYLVGLNGHSLLGFKFLEIVAIILQTPRPLTLRFWRPPRESHASSRASLPSGADSAHDWQSSGTKRGGGKNALSARSMKQQHMRRQQPTSLRVPQQSILDEGECRRIAEYLQPSFLKVADWRLLFSTATHGYRLAGLYDAVRAAEFGPSLLCIRDSNGHVFGAFVNRWNGGMGPVPHTHFFGSGECFLFQARPEFRVFTWTPAAQKANNFDFVLAGDDCLAFGGGTNTMMPRATQNHSSTTLAANNVDSSNTILIPAATSIPAAQFGLWLDRDLNKGSSSPCFTFGNPSSLSSQEDFEVATVELWGFV